MATGAIIGGSMAVSALAGMYGANRQAGAAEDAAAAQRQLGAEASEEIRAAEGEARGFLETGAEQQQAGLGRQAALLGQGRQQVDQYGRMLDRRFAGTRQLGAGAEQRLQDVLLGGDMSQLQIDPAFAFRQEEGNKAIERAAAAAGSFGGGGNLKDFARFNQGLASQEYGSAVQRLMALQGMGAQANAQSAALGMQGMGLQQQLLGQQAGVYGQQGAVAGALGSNLAALRTGTAANAANATVGAGSQAIQYELAGEQAMAQGIANLGNTIGQAGMLYAMYGGQPTPQQAYEPSPFREAGSIRTPVQPAFEYGNPNAFPELRTGPVPYEALEYQLTMPSP